MDSAWKVSAHAARLSWTIRGSLITLVTRDHATGWLSSRLTWPNWPTSYYPKLSLTAVCGDGRSAGPSVADTGAPPESSFSYSKLQKMHPDSIQYWSSGSWALLELLPPPPLLGMPPATFQALIKFFITMRESKLANDDEIKDWVIIGKTKTGYIASCERSASASPCGNW